MGDDGGGVLVGCSRCSWLGVGAAPPSSAERETSASGSAMLSGSVALPCADAALWVGGAAGESERRLETLLAERTLPPEAACGSPKWQTIHASKWASAERTCSFVGGVGSRQHATKGCRRCRGEIKL